MKKDTEKDQLIQLSQDFIERFKANTTKMENGCVAWNGGKTVRLPDNVEGVSFVTPRRAAFIIKNRKLPTQEISLICHTPSCVEPKHFVEGRAARSGTKTAQERLSEKDKAEIKRRYNSGKGESIPALAKEYKVSLGTIHRYVK